MFSKKKHTGMLIYLPSYSINLEIIICVAEAMLSIYASRAMPDLTKPMSRDSVVFLNCLIELSVELSFELANQ
jgi:hypothetical protein